MTKTFLNDNPSPTPKTTEPATVPTAPQGSTTTIPPAERTRAGLAAAIRRNLDARKKRTEKEYEK